MRIEVLDYKPEYQEYFEKLNKSWLEEYFTVEPIDEWVLTKPYEAIISKGGKIYFIALNGEIAGTAALKFESDGVFELTKMTVDKKFQGYGLGKILCKTTVKKAHDLGAKKVILYSHSSLQTAIAIYRKLGFVDIPVEKGRYARADVKMEIDLVSEPFNLFSL
jgi:ribosomal protein S18 acetylase RimI-like enzyme